MSKKSFLSVLSPLPAGRKEPEGLWRRLCRSGAILYRRDAVPSLIIPSRGELWRWQVSIFLRTLIPVRVYTRTRAFFVNGCARPPGFGRPKGLNLRSSSGKKNSEMALDYHRIYIVTDITTLRFFTKIYMKKPPYYWVKLSTYVSGWCSG